MRLRVLVAVELVAAVRALRLAGHEPVGAGCHLLYARRPRCSPTT